MTTRTSSLKVSLIDDVSRKSRAIAKALALAEKQTRALAAASKAGVSGKMATQLQRLGASSRDIEKVTQAWQRYSKAQGLAGDTGKWTKEQIRGVKEWERANIDAIKRVQGRFEKPGRGSRGQAGARVSAKAAGESGLTAGQGAMLGAAVGRAGVLMRAAPVVAVGAGMFKATKAALDFEKVMYQVEKATDSSGAASARYSAAILDMSTKTGSSAKELGGILSAAGFAGRPKEELLDFTSYAAKAANAWETTAEETGQALAEIGNIYQANQARLEQIGDAINGVADASASKETDLLDFIRRTGATAKIMGITAEQTLAIGAAFREIGVTSEVAATGFNALLTKLSTGVGDSDWEKQIKDLGIPVKAFNATLKKDAPGAIKTLLTHINKISDGTKKMSILKDMFGAEYADDIARLSGNLAGYERMLALVADKTKFLGSVSKSFELLKEKDYNRIARFNAQMERLAISVGGPLKIALGAAADQASRLFESFQEGGAGARVVDAINLAAKRYVTDQIAAQESNGAERRDYAPETRKAIEESKIRQENEEYDKRIDRYRRNANSLMERYDWSKPDGKSPSNKLIEDAVGLIKGRHDRLIAARSTRDRAISDKKRLDTRMRGFGDYYGDKPQPLAPNSSRSFGFGPHGTTSGEPIMVSPTMRKLDARGRKVTVAQPLPPPRPDSLPGRVTAPVLKSFDDIYAPAVDTAAISEAESKAKAAGETLQSALGVTVAPKVDTSSIDAALGKARELNRELSSAGAAASRSTGIVGRTLRGNHD